MRDVYLVSSRESLGFVRNKDDFGEQNSVA